MSKMYKDFVLKGILSYPTVTSVDDKGQQLKDRRGNSVIKFKTSICFTDEYNKILKTKINEMKETLPKHQSSICNFRNVEDKYEYLKTKLPAEYSYRMSLSSQLEKIKFFGFGDILDIGELKGGDLVSIAGTFADIEVDKNKKIVAYIRKIKLLKPGVVVFGRSNDDPEPEFDNLKLGEEDELDEFEQKLSDAEIAF